MSLLTIDAGGTSAFASGNPGSMPVWGSCVFVKRGDGKTEEEIDYAFSEWVVWLINTYRPDVFGMEDAWIPRDPKKLTVTVFRIIAMTRIARAIAYGKGVQVVKWNIKEVAAFYGAAGLPSAEKKARVQNIIKTRYGWTHRVDQVTGQIFPLTLDESDALGAWCYGEAKLSPEASAARGIGDLFTAQVMAPRKTRAKRAPREPELGLV